MINLQKKYHSIFHLAPLIKFKYYGKGKKNKRNEKRVAGAGRT